jgi:hypothetical protein
VKANEPELAVTVPDDLPEEDPDPARVATRALVVGSTVVGVEPEGAVAGGIVVTGPPVGGGTIVVVAIVRGAAVGGGPTVVVGPGGVVGATVVGGPPVCEVAIVGDIGEPDGPRAMMPVGALLLGYAAQERARALPDTSRVSLATLS